MAAGCPATLCVSTANCPASSYQVAKKAGREVPSMWEQPQRPTQRCVKFIRWLRCWFFVEAPWHAAVAALAASFASG
jgi:hypothetical protein